MSILTPFQPAGFTRNLAGCVTVADPGRREQVSVHRRSVGIVGGLLVAFAVTGCGTDAPGLAAPLDQSPPAPDEGVPAQVVVRPTVDSLAGPGAAGSFGAVVVDAEGTVLSGVPVTWASLSPGVVAVNRETGATTALAVGTGTIQASAGPATGTAVVVVTGRP